jgi:sialic acid synthase SpsE
LEIGDRMVGLGEPVFIIAEAGINHNGDSGMARKLLDAAVEAGIKSL